MRALYQFLLTTVSLLQVNYILGDANNGFDCQDNSLVKSSDKGKLNHTIKNLDSEAIVV